MSALRVLTWHVHGSYMRTLARTPATFLLPVKPGRPEGYGGRGSADWPANVVEVPAAEVRTAAFDLVLTQSRRNWETDRHELLSPAQLGLPAVHLEHDPPQGSPTDERHFVDSVDTLLVHVTHYNALMWDAGRTPVRVIEHGVEDHGALWTGERARGLTVVNGLSRRGRRLGADVFARAAAALPIDLVGMFSTDAGGLGEVAAADLPAFSAPYRFFFHPIRHTSLGLALLEAMMLGLPPVGLATTELPTFVRDGDNGFCATDEVLLHDAMRALLDDRALAARLGAAARETARARFGIDRFAADWARLFADMTGRRMAKAA